jgi:hypothetical protein
MAEDNTGKKGLHPMAWVGIGCGGIVLIGVVVMALLVGWCSRKVDEVTRDFQENPERAAAEMMVRMNPEVEMVSSDDVAGTMTIREKGSGKEMTLSYSDIGEGKFSVTTEEGTTTIEGGSSGVTTTTPDGQQTTFGSGGLEKMPKMFEVPELVTGWVSMMHSERNGKTTGMVRGEASATLQALDGAFTQALTDGGFKEVSRVSVEKTTNISFENKETKQSVTVSLLEEGNKRMVNLTYVEK